MTYQESLDFIHETVRKYLPKEEYEVFVYGSRATGRAVKWSDIDVGIKGKNKIPSGVLAKISAEIEDSGVPYFVDVVDFSRASERFKKLALRKIVKL